MSCPSKTFIYTSSWKQNKNYIIELGGGAGWIWPVTGRRIESPVDWDLPELTWVNERILYHREPQLVARSCSDSPRNEKKNYSDAVVLTRIFLIFFPLWDNGGHDFLSSRGTLILFLCVCAILKLWRLLFDFQIGILLPMGCGFSKSQWCSGRTKLARLRIIVYTACTQMMR